MKLIDRIAYISFWINIIFIPFIYIIMPVIFIKVPNFNKMMFTFSAGLNPYNLTYLILYSAVIFHWIYCLWFFFKFDRYSKSLFLLIILNAFYAPFYYYGVKIKKRPLQGKIEKTEIVKLEDLSISDEEFLELTRKNVFSVIDLWASKEKQLEYQKDVPIAQVSGELFCQWEDFYLPNSEDFKKAFTDLELEMLDSFDKVINEIANKTPKILPLIDKFVQSDEWLVVNRAAQELMTKINR